MSKLHDRLIVMDIRMPRSTGFEVLEWVKRDGRPLRRIPIVIVSSSDNPSDINQAYELGANSYLVKPQALIKLQQIAHHLGEYWLNANLCRCGTYANVIQAALKVVKGGA